MTRRSDVEYLTIRLYKYMYGLFVKEVCIPFLVVVVLMMVLVA